MLDLDLNTLSHKIHSQNVMIGWWDHWPIKSVRHETAVMLVISELTEAMEGDRKNLMDDHLSDFKAFDVEIADAMIRLLDLAGAYEIELDTTHINQLITSNKHYWDDASSIPEQLYRAICKITEFEGCRHTSVKMGIISVIIIADINNIDLWRLVNMKNDYNKTRADHKIKNRLLPHGKAY